VALVGLGGIGKTQVALQFAYSVKKDCPEFSVFWIPALSMEMFEQACAEIARALGIRQSQESKEDIRELLQQRLSAKTAGKWLLIVDNADDLDLLYGTEQTEGLLDFFPQNDDGLTIFTTRHYEVAQSVANSDVIEVGRMEKQEAIDLLEKSLVRESPFYSYEIVMNFLTELEYLPLAITQAAAYINTNKSSISEYLQLLKKTDQDAIAIMSSEFNDNTRYKNSANAIARTWMITFDQILKHDPVAADLLTFISCIEWKAIPYSILPAVPPEARMVSAIGTLCSYSFLAKRDDEKLDMHRLVHLAVKKWIDQNGWKSETVKGVVKHLSDIFPSDDYTNREIWRDYLPHVARIDKDEQCQDTKEKSELCLKVGRCLYIDGRIREAVLWLQESCKWRDRNLTEDNPIRLASQHELARAYQANGQVKESVKLLEHVVTIQAEILTEDHLDGLTSQHELARAYQANGQVKEAVKLLERVITIQAEVLAENHPSRLASQYGLAQAYQANGQVKEAVKLLEYVVAIQAEILAEDHPSRLVSQHGLARAYQANGQVKEAVKLLEHVITIQAEILIEDHPDRLTSQHELARAYQANGQVKEAVKLLEHVVAIQAEVLAEDHPSRLASRHELARAYQANGQVKEAVELLKHVVAIQAEVLAEDHPSRLASRHELARAYQANGQVKEAVELLEHVVAIQAEVLAEDHPSRLASQHELARVYQANGQVKEAVKLLEHVVTIQAEILAEDHPSRLVSQYELARAYQANGQVKEAVKLLEHVIAIQAEILAEDHPDRLTSQHELARVYQANEQVEEAVKLLEHVVVIQAEVLTEDHPSRLASQHELARAYQANGQIKEAVELLEHVVAIQAEVLTEDHPSRLVSQHELARAYQVSGQVKEAGKLLESILDMNHPSAITTMNDQDISDLISILSVDVPPSLTSGSTLSDTPISTGTAQEFAEMLLSDETLQPLFPAAFERVGPERFKRNLFRLITKYAIDLRAEASTSNQRGAAGLVGSRANYIVYLIAQRMQITEEAPTILQATVLTSERQLDLERFLEQQAERSKPSETPLHITASLEPDLSNLEPFQQPSPHPGEQEEDELGEPGRPRLINLEEAKRFMIESKAFKKLREDFRRFILPNEAAEKPTLIDKTEKDQSALFRSVSGWMPRLCVLILKTLKLNEQEVVPGYHRVQWICVSSPATFYYRANRSQSCGQTFHQDFLASDSPRAIRLCRLLSVAGYDSLIIKRVSAGENGAEARNSPEDAIPGSQSRAIHTLHHTTLATTTERDDSSAPDSMPSWSRGIVSDATIEHRRWLLLCFDFYKHAAKAVHVPLGPKIDDVTIFSTFRENYFEARSLIRRVFSWKEVKTISFVKVSYGHDITAPTLQKVAHPTKFQLRLDPRIMDIDIPTVCEDWDPPIGWSMAHEWEPQPFSKKPDIPSKWLLHHWNHPHDALAFRARQNIMAGFQATAKHLRGWSTVVITRVRRAWIGAIRKWIDSSDSQVSDLPVTSTSTTAENDAPVQIVAIRPCERAASSDSTRRNASAILNATPKKVIRELTASPNDPPYGWGIYLHEGFAVPEAIRTFVLFLLFCFLFGILVYCAKAFVKYGFSIFGFWGSTISLCSLIATLLMKYGDLKK
jgi:tetratricopeptide (TPR) repeat protein